MVRTAASMRSLQHPPPDPSVQATVRALMGPERPVAPIDVDVFAFGSAAPLEVPTKRALCSPGLKFACDMHNKLNGPFALGTEPPVPATPARGSRRSGGASLRSRRRFAWHRGGGAARNLRLRTLGFFAAYARAHAARAIVQVSAF
jgi:hypothetical protein